ncbi:MAG: GIY-YIG nuclease family protein [Candidatus Bathyarchaeia archaeon]
MGKINFERGVYAYVGSAQKGLDKRVNRHLRRVKRKFWHIDYLLENEAVKVLKIFSKKAGKALECEIAEKISQRGIAIKGFGSSDCKCISHLFRLDDYQFLSEFMQET